MYNSLLKRLNASFTILMNAFFGLTCNVQIKAVTFG